MSYILDEALRQLKILQEDWVDEETGENFHEYGTGYIKNPPHDIFDVTTTGVPFYNELLPSSSQEDKNRQIKYNNLVGKIEQLSPEEYYDICQNVIFQASSSNYSLKQQRSFDTKDLDKIKKVILKYKRQLPLGYLNYAKLEQEGLHRMMVLGDTYGWDVKYPVLVVDWYDKKRAEQEKKEKEEKEKRNIANELRVICEELLTYPYKSLEEFIDEVEDSIKKYPHSINIDNDKVRIKVYDTEYTVDIKDIDISSPRKTKPDNLDDIDALLDKMDLDDIDISNFFFR